MKTITIEGIEYVLFPKEKFHELQKKITAQKQLIVSLEKEVHSQ